MFEKYGEIKKKQDFSSYITLTVILGRTTAGRIWRPLFGTITTFVLGIREGAITTCVRGSGALSKVAAGATTATGRAAEQDTKRINIDR